VRQPQDGSTAGGLNVEIPYRFDDAFTVGLAARLAKYYRPELRALLKQDAMEAYGTAARRAHHDLAWLAELLPMRDITITAGLILGPALLLVSAPTR
jgi:hypothetical protein